MKIDVHVHITPPDITRDYKKIGEKEPYFAMLSDSPQNKFATVEDVVAEMDMYGFDKSVVFGFGFKDIGLCGYVNDYVAECVKKYPERLIGFLTVPPTDSGAEREIIRSVQNGLKGIGELFTHGQQFDIADLEGLASFCGICNEMNLPVMLHTNEQIGHSYPGKVNLSFKDIELFARDNPSLKIILAHLGGGILFYELMKEIRSLFKNLYYDTAAMPFLYDSKLYKVIEDIGIAHKLLFGSDFPLLSPVRYEKGLKVSGIRQETEEMILGGNFKRLIL